MSMEKVTKQYILKEKIVEATDTVTLRFSPIEGTTLPFIPGQFVNIYFLDDRCGGQGKPYSISSTPHDAFYDITVKKIGRFSGALHDLQIGEVVSMSEPQGYFYPTDAMHEIVYLAGGIGVTPFYSIIKNDGVKKTERTSTLFYSNKTEGDIAFKKGLEKRAAQQNGLTVIYTLTRQATHSKIYGSERITVDMLKNQLGTLDGKYYFICGSISFVRDLWKELKQHGVTEEYIKVESFY